MRSVRISNRTARELRAFVGPLVEGGGGSAIDRAYSELSDALRPTAVSSARKRTEAKRETKKQEGAQIRAALIERSGGRCEHCSFAADNYGPPELDHFFGRGRAPQTIRNCWLLCRFCHRRKTDNEPTAEHWLQAFIRHCDRYGFAPEAWKAAARLESLKLLPKAVR